jgi:asparagine synthase (glutamine-hydrolysing)
LSAICGFWSLNGDTDTTSVCARMLDALAMHGPDGQAERQNGSPGDRGAGSVALGHRLLRVTAEDAYEAQPASFQTGDSEAGPTYWLVADARIDNRNELASLLDIRPEELARMPDSAFILKAWQRWGRECVQHLAGSFAFAVWDARAEEFFLARDHAGDRPLYYCKTPKFFAFATTARAIRACPGVSSELDPRQLARDLMGLPPESPATRFLAIKALAPGHCLVAGRERAVSRRYWQIFSLKPIRFARDSDYVEAFLEIFDEAVRCRLRTAGGIATELSAGLDSGAVAATAAGLLAGAGKGISAYTAVPRPGFSGVVPRGLIADEGPYAAEVAAFYPNMRHHRVDATGSDMFRELARIFPLLDIPHAAALNGVWSNLILDHAAASGVKVLLAGSLGNFTVSYSGSEILHHMFRHGRWAAMLRMAWHLRSIGLSSGRNAASQTIFTLLPWALRTRVDPLIRGIAVDWTALSPAAAREFNVIDQVRRYQHVRTGSLPRLMASQFQFNQYGDYNAACSAGWGIDTRDPTADKRVFEFCAAIPSEQFLVGGQGRSLIRRAMRGRLPQSTLEREEKGTQAADWYESLSAIRPQLEAELALLERSPGAKHLLDLEMLRGALDAWPETAEEAAERSGVYQSAIPRGMAVGYFIRRVEAEAVVQTR